jgi:hypothetical protein
MSETFLHSLTFLFLFPLKMLANAAQVVLFKKEAKF